MVAVAWRVGATMAYRINVSAVAQFPQPLIAAGDA
jgi:hypothetical protein